MIENLKIIEYYRCFLLTSRKHIYVLTTPLSCKPLNKAGKKCFIKCMVQITILYFCHAKLLYLVQIYKTENVSEETT